MPISAELATQIRRGPAGYGAYHHGNYGYLFPGQIGGHVSVDWVGTMISRLLPDGYSIHSLRHRFATRAYRGSRNLRAVQELLGHASIATTQVYVAVDDDEIRAAAACAW